MAENAFGTLTDDDLTESNPEDNDLIKKLRKQLKDEKTARKTAESENEGFRETRSQARDAAIKAAVNDSEYPQAIVDAIVAKAQDADEAEYLTILADLTVVADEEDPGTTAPEGGTTELAPTPSSLGQQVAAAASGGSAVDGVARLAAAESIDEVNAIAADLGLGDV